MTRIWLNHWFSTAYHIIRLLKEDNPDFYVIGSNANAVSPIMAVCDEWYQEPVLEDEEYVAFCLQFCQDHQIDLFLPRRGALAVSRHIGRFARLGVKVMVDNYDIVETLNDKGRAYRLFQQEQIGIVPEYRIVTNAEQFREGYHALLEHGRQVCFKFVRDEGGQSFHLIDNDHRGYSALCRRSSTRLPFDEAILALSERESFPPILMMPYLPGEEVSVDCLYTQDGLIAIPRFKGPTRVETVRYDPQILGFCDDLYAKLPLRHPCNIQFKYLDGIPYILEVNTRMSGGVQLSCAVSGINIPSIAANQLLGVRKTWEDRHIERDVSYVEYPVVL